MIPVMIKYNLGIRNHDISEFHPNLVYLDYLALPRLSSPVGAALFPPKMIRALGAVWAALSSILTLAPWAPFSPAYDSDIAAHDPFEMQKSWGVYSPFHAVDDYIPPPTGCNISQVIHLLYLPARCPDSCAAGQHRQSFPCNYNNFSRCSIA